MTATTPHATAIGYVNMGTVEIVIAIAITIEHRIVPTGLIPTHRTIEIGQRAIKIILPIEEYATQVCIAIRPIISTTV